MNKAESLLIKNADYIVTLDKKRRVLRNASIFIEGKQILEVGTRRRHADINVNASGMVVYPGFVNTHLHIPQVFHRHCPAQQNKPIAEWIAVTTSINRELDEEAVYYGALVCFTELMLSGVTTTLDYFYPFIRGKKGLMEAAIKAAHDIGIRFTCVRGSMSLSKRQGTLYDDDVVENLDAILTHSQKIINTYHDSEKYSLCRIGLGPCLPFASTKEDYIETAKLARKYPGVILQTHAAESLWEVEYCYKKFGTTPIGLMKKTGFLGKDVSLVHCNIVSEAEVKFLGRSKTNVVITPICNTRDASDGNGIAPISKLLRSGANISIGVDGPASNDSMNIQDEMRYLRVVSKGKEGLFWYKGQNQARFSYLHPQDVLEITNLGGATTLNRNDIGSIEAGKAADVAIFGPDQEISHAGSVNKWASILSCQPLKPKYLLINGKVIIKDKILQTVNTEVINQKFREIHKGVINRAQKHSKRNLIEYPNTNIC